MKVHVEVTHTDIDRGEPDNARGCPVALALLRAVPGCKPWVEQMTVSLRGLRGPRYMLPGVASDFIEKFDDNPEEGVAPIAFDLDLPDETTP